MARLLPGRVGRANPVGAGCVSVGRPPSPPRHPLIVEWTEGRQAAEHERRPVAGCAFHAFRMEMSRATTVECRRPARNRRHASGQLTSPRWTSLKRRMQPAS